MTEKHNDAVEAAFAYHRAWTTGDLDGAMENVTDDVICHAPLGTLSGVIALRGFMGPFAASLTSSSLLAAFGDADQALLMYDTANPVVPSAPGAELYRIRGGRIAEIRIIFDRLPFALARGEVVQVR